MTAAVLNAIAEITDIEVMRDTATRVIAELQSAIAKRDAALKRKSTHIEHLELLLATLRRQRFGARSEQFNTEQHGLWDAALDEDIAATATEVEQSTKAPRERAQPKRQALPAELPRVEERIEPVSCTCGACGGELHSIGEEVSEKLDLKPVECFVRRIIRPKLACRTCETIQTPPTLPAIIERGIPAPGLLAHVLISKYADHLPLSRQGEMLGRSGVDLPVSTLSEWVGVTGFALQPLVDALRDELHRACVVHADETPVQMLDPGRGKTKTAYLFAYRRGEIAEPPIIVFDFADNRSGAHPPQRQDRYPRLRRRPVARLLRPVAPDDRCRRAVTSGLHFVNVGWPEAYCATWRGAPESRRASSPGGGHARTGQCRNRSEQRACSPVWPGPSQFSAPTLAHSAPAFKVAGGGATQVGLFTLCGLCRCD